MGVDLEDPRPWLFAGVGIVAFQASIGIFVARGQRGTPWALGQDLLDQLRDGLAGRSGEPANGEEPGRLEA
jgi:hypothetical protein